MLYQKQLRKQMMKSAMIIVFLFLFAIGSTYFIYNQFKDERDAKVNSSHLEVTFHEKTKDKISLLQFYPVSDAVGLSSRAYTFTVQNQTDYPISYQIELIDDEQAQEKDQCGTDLIPKELLKLSVRKDHEVADAVLLSDFPNHILRKDYLEAHQKEDYTIRIWAVNSSFVLNSTAHYHGIIKVTEL